MMWYDVRNLVFRLNNTSKEKCKNKYWGLSLYFLYGKMRSNINLMEEFRDNAISEQYRATESLDRISPKWKLIDKHFE